MLFFNGIFFVSCLYIPITLSCVYKYFSNVQWKINVHFLITRLFVFFIFSSNVDGLDLAFLSEMSYTINSQNHPENFHTLN